MANEALDSLLEILNRILKQSHHPDINQEIIIIRDEAVFLQSQLKSNAEILDEQIEEATHTTRKFIDYLFSEDYPFYVGWMKPTEEHLTQLKKAAHNFRLNAGDAPHSVDCKLLNDLSMNPSSRTVTANKDVVVGLDEDLKEIRNRLGYGNPSQLQVISIVGMGGTGKTTLAKLVYNDESVVYEFGICAWLTASQDHSVGRIFLDLGLSLERDEERHIPTELLIRRHLEKMRFLIIIDDLSSKKTWDYLKMLFPDTNSGSRIILTTRQHDVAAYADSSSPVHTMRLLDAHHGWELLQKKVFVDEPCPFLLEDIGKKIVKNSGGLPLSIVVVAGILSSVPKTRDSWMQIAAHYCNVETIISLSYNLLSVDMKACFIYMGAFPEDYEIRTSELVNLWIAEGFLNCEEEAANCLDDLVHRNLVSVSRSRYDGKIKGCRLHDMVRDFCIKQAEREKFLLSVVDYLPTPILRRHFLPRLLKNYGRISATWHDLHLKDSSHTSLTHSIICIPRRGYKCKTCMRKFSSLRVFHVLRGYDSCEWEPTQLFDLIKLTYLASNIPTNTVPPAISKLENLQTLIIYRSEVFLPVEILMLRHLRHLVALSFYPPPCPDWETLPLVNLQTMSLALNFVCSERMMEMIPNIKKLGICYSTGCSKKKMNMIQKIKKLAICNSTGKCYPCYGLNNLRHLHQLEKLKLESKIGRGFLENDYLTFPFSLKKVNLCGLELSWEDMRIIGSLPNLQVLKLRNNACTDEYWKTMEGEFKELRVLLIDGSSLKSWTSEDNSFGRLECLILLHCPHLNEIPRIIEVVPTLKLIELDTSKGLLFSSVQNIKLEQQRHGNDRLEVRVKRS